MDYTPPGEAFFAFMLAYLLFYLCFAGAP